VTIAANDVDVISVQTAQLNFPAGTAIPVNVEVEAGTALFATGGHYQVRLTATDTTNPLLLDQQQIDGSYGDIHWPTPNSTITFTVPSTATTSHAGDKILPRAVVFGNRVAPFDASSADGELVLLTP